MKGFVAPATLFEELGFNYVGPIDGHDLPNLVQTIRNMRELHRTRCLRQHHLQGKGFGPAERDPVGYHALSKLEPQATANAAPADTPKLATKKGPKYQDVFGSWLCDMAAREPKLIGITPAMSEGSGMVEFSPALRRTLLRCRHRRTARGDARRRYGLRWLETRRRDLLDVLTTCVRPADSRRRTAKILTCCL